MLNNIGLNYLLIPNEGVWGFIVLDKGMTPDEIMLTIALGEHDVKPVNFNLQRSSCYGTGTRWRKNIIMEHDINLNIHYSAPEEVWEKVGKVYESMPYWSGYDNGAEWIGIAINLWASVEPGGIQIAGTMPEDIWNEWYSNLKSELSKVLGYEIGEPGEGFEFKYW